MSFWKSTYRKPDSKK